MTITKQDTFSWNNPKNQKMDHTPGEHFGRFSIGQVCCEGGNNNKIPF